MVVLGLGLGLGLGFGLHHGKVKAPRGPYVPVVSAVAVCQSLHGSSANQMDAALGLPANSDNSTITPAEYAQIRNRFAGIDDPAVKAALTKFIDDLMGYQTA